jgi:hypothetical protein
MKNPQTLAEELYKHFPTPKLKSIKDYACCVFTLFWYLGIDCSDIDAIMMVSDLIDKKALDPDCTVYWAKCIYQLTGREMESLEKVPFTNLKKIKGRAIVRFTKGQTGHWVGVEDGKVVFNSLKKSVCVNDGKPSEMRVIKIKGVNS